MTKVSDRSLYMLTLGCPKNRVDSEVMLGTLVQRGYALVDDPADALVIVVNTCAFLKAAEQESVDQILEFAEHKKSGRCRTLVVTGCLVQRHGEALVTSLPEVDHFLGTSAYYQVGDLLAAEASPRLTMPDPDYIHSAAVPKVNSMPGYTAYLKVSEGCDNTCAFCIIPKLRGLQRSRPIADLVREAGQLADQGVRELNLIAQDLTAYGYDLPGRPKLHELLRELVKVDVHWLRLHYAYPRVFPDELYDVMASEPKIAKYLDMPLQHASDKLLKSMKRGRDSAFLERLVGKLRARVPGLTMRTSLIVGLPGETFEDFELLKDFVKRLRFERLGVFPYSDEPGTAAFELAGKVPKKTIDRRWRDLMATQKRISREQNKALVGQRLEVLVEGASEESEHLLVGRHQGQAPEIDGQVYLNEGPSTELGTGPSTELGTGPSTELGTGLALPGELVTVEVTEAHDYDLVARIVGRRDERRHAAVALASVQLPASW